MLSQKSFRCGRHTSTRDASEIAWLAAVSPPIKRPAIKSETDPHAKATPIVA